MKIRIFALAKELGLDSKELIEHAAGAGIKLKNSALASITPEQKDVLLAHLEKVRTAGESAKAAPAPVREQPRDVKEKVRTIQAPARKAGRTSEAGSGEDVETPSAGGTETATTVAERPAETVAEAEPAAPEKTPRPSGEDRGDEEEGVTPISREDYVPAAGGGSSRVREMKPRGTVPGAGGGPGRQGRGRGRPSLPSVAEPPSYSPPKPRPKEEEEGPTQKPDIPLTADILEQQSPLGARLQKKKRRKTEGDEGIQARETGRKGGRAPLERELAERQGRRERTSRRRRVTQEDLDAAGPVTGRMRPKRRRQKSQRTVELKTSAVVELPVTLRGFSEAVGRPINQLMRILLEQNQMYTINDNLPEEVCLELALELGVDLEFKRERDLEAELSETLTAEDPPETLHERPPIVTILGHVDHGKTTLLDKIRSGNVAAGEAGGITQHIAAYQVQHDARRITFVDTPGHAAFGEMRARGANVTDIVVLVVAADDGVMPQTVECISHAKAAGVPIVVAMNKIDLADADEQKVLQGLAGQDLLPAEWGGDVEVIRTSGETGQGLDELLETILVSAELQEFQANPLRPGVGVCLEAFMDEGRGPVAWMIVQKGTLRVGDVVLCGPAFGRIRAMYDDLDNELQEAGPSTPIKVAGLDVVPGAGNHFFVMDDIEDARNVAELRRHRGRTEDLAGQSRPRTLEDILAAARGGTVQDLPLIIKADTPGSLEALRSEIEKFEHPEVRVRIVHDGVGGVNESDVSLAEASEAIVIAFHVIAEDRAAGLARTKGVDIRRFSIIYEVTETIKRALEGLLLPERVEVVTGRALVLQTFHISRFGTIAGCRVLGGNIERAHRVHVIRDQTVLNDYPIASLRREKDDVKEVREGMECGIRLDGFNDIKEGDLLEAYRVDEIKRTLEGTAATA